MVRKTTLAAILKTNCLKLKNIIDGSKAAAIAMSGSREKGTTVDSPGHRTD